MTSNQIKLLLCIFQVFVISGGMYAYVFWRQINPDAYYELLSFIYILILGITELTVAIVLFILMLSRVQITSFNMLFRYIREHLYKEYYALILINLKFLLISCTIGIVDNRAFSFQTKESYHFIGSFYLQCILYIGFSRDLLKRRALIPNEHMFEREGIFRCGYEVMYHLISLYVLISYFLVVRWEQFPVFESCLSQFIIFTLLYFIYSITRLGIIIKIFLFIVSCRLLSQTINGIPKTNDLPELILLIILLGLFILRIAQQMIKGFMKAKHMYYHNPENMPVDILGALNLLPERDPYHSRVLSEFALSYAEIQALPQMPFSGVLSDQICSICDMLLIKDEIIVNLPCQHQFHSECLKPWLRLKNSCPNCRTIVVNRDHNMQAIIQE